MSRTTAILAEFERTFDPMDLSKSTVPSHLVGYGEISAIFAIEAIEGLVFKRMPLFRSQEQALGYLANYREYCRLLTEAGLELPPDECYIIPKNERLFVLYIGQKEYPAETLCHRRIHRQSTEESLRMLDAVIGGLEAVRIFNDTHRPALEVAIDGQLSNWVWLEEPAGNRLIFIDTSTPLFRRSGVETMDPELILKSAPAPLQAIIRAFFLDDVMNRYYQPQGIFSDLLGNLHKEGQPGLIPPFLDRINPYLPADQQLTANQIDRFYREDRFIWSFFLSARRLDRWVKRNILGRSYEFLLPGKINR